MAGSIEPADPESRDVAVNVVPFIDLMSCLTAFLLVTAVWSAYAQIPVEHKGTGTGSGDEQLKLSAGVLVAPDDLWLGLSTGERYRFPAIGGHHDWNSLERELSLLAQRPEVQGIPVEIAAEDAVLYGELVTAMDVATTTGFRVSVIDPASLTVALAE